MFSGLLYSLVTVIILSLASVYFIPIQLNGFLSHLRETLTVLKHTISVVCF